MNGAPAKASLRPARSRTLPVSASRKARPAGLRRIPRRSSGASSATSSPGSARSRSPRSGQATCWTCFDVSNPAVRSNDAPGAAELRSGLSIRRRHRACSWVSRHGRDDAPRARLAVRRDRETALACRAQLSEGCLQPCRAPPCPAQDDAGLGGLPGEVAQRRRRAAHSTDPRARCFVARLPSGGHAADSTCWRVTR